MKAPYVLRCPTRLALELAPWLARYETYWAEAPARGGRETGTQGHRTGVWLY
jgi:hypothetical protein